MDSPIVIAGGIALIIALFAIGIHYLIEYVSSKNENMGKRNGPQKQDVEQLKMLNMGTTK